MYAEEWVSRYSLKKLVTQLKENQTRRRRALVKPIPAIIWDGVAEATEELIKLEIIMNANTGKRTPRRRIGIRSVKRFKACGANILIIVNEKIIERVR